MAKTSGWGDSGNQNSEAEVWPPAPTSLPTGQDQIRAGQEAAKLRLQVRLFGVCLFLVGLGMVWWLRSEVISGAKVSGKIVVILPIVLLGSLGFIVEPRIMVATTKDAGPDYKRYKIAGHILGGIGLVIGLYIALTFFS